MPNSKSRPGPDESSSLARERPAAIAASNYARKSKTNTAALPTSADNTSSGAGNGDSSALGSQNSGSSIAWNQAPLEMLNKYRVAYGLHTPAAFTSLLHQAILTNPGIGRQSPTMARRKDKRRVPRETLATAVRKNFNGAAVNETDVVVELVYKVRHQNKTFRMRSLPNGVAKKS